MIGRIWASQSRPSTSFAALVPKIAPELPLKTPRNDLVRCPMISSMANCDCCQLRASGESNYEPTCTDSQSSRRLAGPWRYDRQDRAARGPRTSSVASLGRGRMRSLACATTAHALPARIREDASPARCAVSLDRIARGAERTAKPTQSAPTSDCHRLARGSKCTAADPR